MDITELLAFAVKHKASDLHLSSGLSPMIRVDGEVHRINVPPLEGEAVLTLIHSTMSDLQKEEFEKHLETDYSFDIPQLSRFRVNVFNQQRGPGAVFRVISSTVKSIEEMGLLPVFSERLVKFRNGLVVVTGPTGSGKSTTLAAMIDYINKSRPEHILTIEDPIEYIHEPQKCLINQREVHHHTASFSAALRSALREDPDVILVGEMRDPETIGLAMTAAETGHLVFGTLHTTSASKTINRIIDVFPSGDKEMIRSMLSESLQAVVSQALIKKVGGGRVAACEIMVCNPAIRNLIREDKVSQMYNAIQTNQEEGMQTMDMHLKVLYEKGAISKESAHHYAINKLPYSEP